MSNLRNRKGDKDKKTSAAADVVETKTNAKEEVDEVAPQEDAGPPADTYLFGLIFIPYFLRSVAMLGVYSAVTAYAVWNAYRIRLFALIEFGRVIHEFDPWFNFRATQYLSKHGWTAFFSWYDYMSWSPLGRPVGSTIYPGLQITSVAIHRALRYLGKPYKMSLNDVCCFVPAWFGSIASVFLGLLAYECSGYPAAGVAAAMIMAIIPAHIMRSVGGGFDNESIAMSAICCTFYLWVRSLRSKNISTDSSSWMFGILAGFSYGFMVAAWGGFIFVINVIALHAALLLVVDWAKGQFSVQLFRSYTCFFVIGTFIATRVPPVGMGPFKSLEQISGLLVFLGMQVLYLSELKRRSLGIKRIWSFRGVKVRFAYLFGFLAVLVVVAVILMPTGFFGPLSSRIRGLFVKHMKTGNPLVDSVAEHQPASPEAFWQYLHYCSFIAPAGMSIVAIHNFRQSSFIVLVACVVYFFALKMARLIILASIPAAALTGIVIGSAIDTALSDFWVPKKKTEEEPAASPAVGLQKLQRRFFAVWLSIPLRILRIAFVGFAIYWSLPRVKEFVAAAEESAHRHSHPQIMFMHKQGGRNVIIDDYREAYFWLRDKTEQDARVLAWWDYGYQITGIGNRTTIADGNTWNHEHIATIGRCLTSPVKQAHRMVRHLADYVLVWSGGNGDDLGKSPWMARIGNSIYRDICPQDPLCEHFGFHRDNTPTPMMAKSLLYNIHSAGLKPGVGPDKKYFTEAYTSKHGLVRIFKVMNVSVESKAHTADPANRICDAPGSWYCEGQYPPAEELQKVLRKRRSFSQRDFNKGKDDGFSDAYLKRSRGER